MTTLPDYTLPSVETKPNVSRRGFLAKAGAVGLGAAAAGLGASTPYRSQAQAGKDSIAQIFTTLLVAEDLATTFYYNVLVGQVIQATQLAGPGGTALAPAGGGVRGNVQYMRSAFFQEWSHANLIRSALGSSNFTQDPVQTFYLPQSAFTDINGFADMLATLENAFIGAYMTAIQEFATKAALGGAQGGTYTDIDGHTYSSAQLVYFAKAAASILGVESEHRILGRVISDREPGDNVLYEGTDGLSSLFSGPNSAAAALKPFLTPGTGPAYQLQTAQANQTALGLPVQGSLPSAF